MRYTELFDFVLDSGEIRSSKHMIKEKQNSYIDTGSTLKQKSPYTGKILNFHIIDLPLRSHTT